MKKTQTKESIESDINALAEELSRSIEKAKSNLLSIQYPKGYWWGELESNVTIVAEYLLLTHFLGVKDAGRWEKIVAYLKSQQLPDGSWRNYYGGPGEVSTTVEAYFALKLAGVSSEEPFMLKARDFVLSKGGVPKVRVFTKIWLSLFGEWDWNGVPVMPPELILFPSWFPFNIYEFASWARATIVAMLAILAYKPVCPVPEWARIDELYPVPRDKVDYPLPRKPSSFFSWRNFFYIADKLLRLYGRIPWKPRRGKALKAIERWILDHQEADGSWAGIQPPWVYSIIALRCLGYPLDHPVIVKAIEGFENFAIEEDDTWRVQSCVSPVWDTALAMIGLIDAGFPPDHPVLVKAGEWLLKEQIKSGGDWQIKNKKGPPGGWAFEFDNDIYPDTDDAAEVMIALIKTRLPNEEAKKKSLDLGLKWLLSMQSRNGGWGAFDVDNTKHFVTQIPFADFGETLDPPSVDVTAHIVELLGIMGYKRDFPPLKRALRYIRVEQEKDGCWFGRWGVNYIYGTGAVLPALKAIGENMGQEYIRKAVDWLVAHQNRDGGWGETCASYDDPSLRGQGESTASQTAWALMALLSAGEGGNPATERGIRYLIETQKGDGSWDEPYFTGTGFPRHFLINYHLYRDYFPLTALGRYASYLKGHLSDKKLIY